MVESAPYWTSGSLPTTSTATITSPYLKGPKGIVSSGTWSPLSSGSVTAMGSGWSGGITTGTWATSGTFSLSWDEGSFLTKEEWALVRGAVMDEVLREWPL